MAVGHPLLQSFWANEAVFQMMMLACNLFSLFKFDSLHISEYRQQISGCEDHQNGTVCSDEALGKISLSRCVSKMSGMTFLFNYTGLFFIFNREGKNVLKHSVLRNC